MSAFPPPSPLGRSAAAVTVVAAAAIAGATFLPWSLTSAEGFGTRPANGWTGRPGETNWGVVLVAVALLVAALAGAMASGVRSLRAAVCNLTFAVIAAVIAGARLRESAPTGSGLTMTTAYGVYVLIGAAALAVVAATVTVIAARPAKVTPPRAVGAVG